ncbi:hypothetical protein ACH35V_21150 [Actinomadura sp. 1N219]|uniref:hypothetical protein n=1 Tax=Actinomadura sp. 1N219 TaxID=3375152 RepID=UPI0037A0C394
MREVLAERDADLARQQEAIGARRARLAALLADVGLGADSVVSPEWRTFCAACRATRGSRKLTGGCWRRRDCGRARVRSDAASAY